MTDNFTSQRTSLAPVASALASATAEYATNRAASEEAHFALSEARLTGAQNVSALADQSDAAIEAMSAAQEQIANLMADLKEQGVLDGFYAFAAAQNRHQT
ncbi:hypothetical protein ACFP4H_16900 [Pseudophaeobacter arcticus]|uniref:hypothetical protein n=1 Tax=Pseudophaeobacter arcticus TaxID=385492 RepID=UPI00048137CB|nr:hypothetical protein [Pseudophaeobacter arcticus]